METATLIARLLLAAVFGVAGLAKLADLPGSRQALRDFGVPSRLATPFVIFIASFTNKEAGHYLWSFINRRNNFVGYHQSR